MCLICKIWMWPALITSKLNIHQKKSTQTTFKQLVVGVVAVFSGWLQYWECFSRGNVWPLSKKCSSVQGFFVLKVIKATGGEKNPAACKSASRAGEKKHNKKTQPRGGTFCLGIANIYLLLVEWVCSSSRLPAWARGDTWPYSPPWRRRCLTVQVWTHRSQSTAGKTRMA